MEAFRPGTAADEEDVDVDTLVDGQAAAGYGQVPGYAAQVAPQMSEPVAPPKPAGRSRPTNNQLL